MEIMSADTLGLTAGAFKLGSSSRYDEYKVAGASPPRQDEGNKLERAHVLFLSITLLHVSVVLLLALTPGGCPIQFFIVGNSVCGALLKGT